MTTAAILLGYLGAVAFAVMVIRRAGRETVRTSRFARLVDEDSDER